MCGVQIVVHTYYIVVPTGGPNITVHPYNIVVQNIQILSKPDIGKPDIVVYLQYHRYQESRCSNAGWAAAPQ
jgi:hypothetical protein